jgi:hypothetical protein
MHQIADWLEKLGMSEYAERFAENGINVAALPHLTDQDLKDIGVLLGHRRIILAAISKPAGAALATPEPTPRAAEPKDTGERRQVTVMFSDLVGSTALSARMDPEDLREVISAYQKCVAEKVQRFGGFVAKYMGDGVLVYFGYPQAHEDDAERAVRAGLELVAAVSSCPPDADMAQSRARRTSSMRCPYLLIHSFAFRISQCLSASRRAPARRWQTPSAACAPVRGRYASRSTQRSY